MIELTVVNHTVLQNKINGRVQSLYGSAPPDPENWETVNRGYTWKIVDHRGVTTYGLGKVPAKTIEEANNVALKYQQAIPNVTVNLMEPTND